MDEELGDPTDDVSHSACKYGFRRKSSGSRALSLTEIYKIILLSTATLWCTRFRIYLPPQSPRAHIAKGGEQDAAVQGWLESNFVDT